MKHIEGIKEEWKTQRLEQRNKIAVLKDQGRIKHTAKERGKSTLS